MIRCNHMFVSKGRYFEREPHRFGSELFTVFQVKKCAHCDKQERKVELRKKVTASPDAYERQLRFSGVKPANQVN
jgi:hypothetical protein